MTGSQHARAVVEAFCALEPAEAWAAFRELAADRAESEDLRVRAAAWLAIAHAVGSLRGDESRGQDEGNS